MNAKKANREKWGIWMAPTGSGRVRHGGWLRTDRTRGASPRLPVTGNEAWARREAEMLNAGKPTDLGVVYLPQPFHGVAFSDVSGELRQKRMTTRSSVLHDALGPEAANAAFLTEKEEPLERYLLLTSAAAGHDWTYHTTIEEAAEAAALDYGNDAGWGARCLVDLDTGEGFVPEVTVRWRPKR